MNPFLKNLCASPVLAALLFVIGCIVIAASGTEAQVYKWSLTPASNATADPNINWAEGMSPSAVNDSARAMMAALAEVRDDWSGKIDGGGSASAYTVTSNQGFDSLTHLDNQQICFIPNSTNAAGVTLSVDGLTPEPIESPIGSPIGAGVMVLHTPYCVIYNNANQQFLLRSLTGNPFNVPLGVLLPYTASGAPNSNFVLAFGQCISRSTYAGYFALVGTNYGNCDGSTTFGVPDIRGTIVAGLDNMGGSNVGRLAGACGSGLTALGQTCGQAFLALSASNIPQVTGSYTPSGTIGSSQTVNVASIVDGGGAQNYAPGGIAINQVNRTVSGSSFSFSGTPATITVGNPSPSAVVTVQPTFGVNYILRIL